MQYGARCRPGGGGWWRGASGYACTRGKGPTQGLGARARAERTPNIMYMFVTWDVSKLSGWLKANAVPCQVEGRACDAG
jgi:hypothetical protein